MPKPTTPKYRTTNRSDYNAAFKLRGSLEIWLDPGMQWLSAANGRPARPKLFFGQRDCGLSDVEGGLWPAAASGDGRVANLLKMAKLDWPVPDYTTLCRRQKALAVPNGGRASAGGLHLLVDSTGIKMMGEGEWKTRKHGASYRRQWCKPVLSQSKGSPRDRC